MSEITPSPGSCKQEKRKTTGGELTRVGMYRHYPVRYSDVILIKLPSRERESERARERESELKRVFSDIWCS